MRIRLVLLGTLLFVGLFAISAIWPRTKGLTDSKVLASMKQEHTSNNPFHDLNEKAKRMRGGDLKSTNDLAEDVITKFGFLESDATVKESVKQRLVRAEIKFQTEGIGDISEEDVALMINNLAAQLGAPDFMKTDVQQVRHIRMVGMVYVPNLINQQTGREKHVSNKSSDSSVSSRLSPLEAIYVAMDLLYQKIHLPEYQVSPAQFRANLNKKRLEMWRARQNREGKIGDLAAEGADKASYQLKEPDSSSDRKELKLSAGRAAAMTPTDLLNLANASLDTLGIDR